MLELGLIVSLAMVVAGAEVLVRGASALALRLGLSPLFIGITVVGFGTSTPELSASLVATWRGVTDVSVGNVVGSNLFNIGIILGMTAMLRPVTISLRAVTPEIAWAMAAVPVPVLALAAGGWLTRPVGVLLVALLGTNIALAARRARRASRAETSRADRELGEAGLVRPGAGVWWSALGILAGLALLVFGSRIFVGSALELAGRWGIPPVIVGLTVVAMGTSLPELVTSLVAARRGSVDIALGNVLGSNVFNAFGILGVSALVSPQQVSVPILVRDTPVLLVLTVLLVPLLRTGGSISRREGLLLIGIYIVYLGVLLGSGRA